MRELWEETIALASVLQRSAPIQRFAAIWRGDAPASDSELATQLQEILAAFNLLRWQPFLISLRLNHLPGSETLARDPASSQFRHDSIAVSVATIALIEWLRSRMPRYPIRFKLPYTDPLSSRVAEDGFPDGRWPWLFRARQGNFQAQPTVATQMASALEVDVSEVRERLLRLEEALHESEAWSGYVRASRALTDADESALGEILTMFRSLTAPEELSRVAGDRVIRRMQQRHAALRLAEDEAHARGLVVNDYYAAFRRLDRTFGNISALLGQLLIFGAPHRVDPSRVSWRRSREGELEVALVTAGIPNLNELVVQIASDIPPLSGLILVEGLRFSFRRRGEAFVEEVRFDGVLIPQSSGLGLHRPQTEDAMK